MNDGDPMPLERFEALAEAYGAVVARWPDAEREAALSRALERAFAAVLTRAAALDATLDAWTVAAPAAELSHGIVASAPAPGRSLGTRARLWWSGIGLAAALTGAAAGVAGVAMAAPGELSSSDANTSFGDLAGQVS